MDTSHALLREHIGHAHEQASSPSDRKSPCPTASGVEALRMLMFQTARVNAALKLDIESKKLVNRIRTSRRARNIDAGRGNPCGSTCLRHMTVDKAPDEHRLQEKTLAGSKSGETIDQYKKMLRRTALRMPRRHVRAAVEQIKKRAQAIFEADGNDIALD